MQVRARLSVLIAVVALLASACAAGESQRTSSGQPSGEVTLKIAASTPLQWPHVWVAEKEGMWSQEGIQPEVTLFQEGAQALQALTAGAVDIATAAPTPLVAAINSGQEIRVIAVTDRWSKWRVVANQDHGITRPADLKGKKIGVPLGTAAEATLNKFLAENNLSAEDVELVNVAPPNIASALSTGSVDAVNVWVPHIVNAERELGDKAVAFPYSFSANYLLITTESVLSQKREELAKAIKVFQEADKILADSPDTAAKMVTEMAGIDADSLSEIWRTEFTFGTEAPDAAVREEFEANIEFAKSKDRIPQDADIPLDEVLVDITK